MDALTETEAQAKSKYVYHYTLASEVESIGKEGLRPVQSPWAEDDAVKRTNQLIESYADETDISLPFERDNCVFAFPQWEDTRRLALLQGQQLDEALAVLVIDSAALDGDVFYANARSVDDIINEFGSYELAEVDSQTVARRAGTYIDSIAELDGDPSQIPEVQDRSAPIQEIIVPGGIPSEAIVGVVESEHLLR